MGTITLYIRRILWLRRLIFTQEYRWTSPTAKWHFSDSDSHHGGYGFGWHKQQLRFSFYLSLTPFVRHSTFVHVAVVICVSRGSLQLNQLQQCLALQHRKDLRATTEGAMQWNLRKLNIIIFYRIQLKNGRVKLQFLNTAIKKIRDKNDKSSLSFQHEYYIDFNFLLFRLIILHTCIFKRSLRKNLLAI